MEAIKIVREISNRLDELKEEIEEIEDLEYTIAKQRDELDDQESIIEDLEDALKEFEQPDYHEYLLSGSEIKIFGDRLTLSEKEAIEEFLVKLKQ